MLLHLTGAGATKMERNRRRGSAQSRVAPLAGLALAAFPTQGALL